MDGDDDMRRHRLNDVARPLTCQVVAVSCCPSTVWLMTWHGLIVIIVGMSSGGSGHVGVCSGGGGQSNGGGGCWWQR